MNQMKTTATALAVIVLATGGCAVTPHEVNLDTPHEVNLDLVSQVQTYPMAPIRSTPIYVSVLDYRESSLVGQRSPLEAKRRVKVGGAEVEIGGQKLDTCSGTRLVGTGGDRAKIKAPRLLPEVNAAVRAMFTRKGYQLVPDPQATVTNVEVRLCEANFFYTGGFWTARQHVSAVISVMIIDNGNIFEWNSYKSKDTRRRFVRAFGEEVDQLLNHHLTEVIRKIANDEALHEFLAD